MLGYLAQIVSVLCFGLSNSLWHQPTQQIPFYKAIFYRTIVSFSIFLVLVLFFDFSINASALSYIKTIAIAAVCAFGLYFYIKGISLTSTSLVVTVGASSYLFGQLTAILVLGEKPSINHLFIVILFLGAIVLSDWNNNKKLQFNSGTIYGLFAAIIWGITFPLLSVSAKDIGFIQTSFIVEMCVLIMSFVFSFKHFFEPRKQEKINPIWFIALGTLAAFGLLLQYYAYTLIPVFKAGSISSVTHIVAIVCSVLIFKEKVSKYIKYASLLGAVGILLTVL